MGSQRVGQDLSTKKQLLRGSKGKKDILCMTFERSKKISSVTVMSNSLWPHGLQHARLLCPPLSPRVCSHSCPFTQWCYLTISSSASISPFAFSLSQHQGLSQWVGSSHQVAKVLELQRQHHSSSEYSGLISFRIDWFDVPADQETLKSLLQHHSLKALILQY